MPYNNVRKGRDFEVINSEIHRIETVFSSSQYGSRRIQQLFLIEDNINFLNNGSFGATPRIVLLAQQFWREKMEMQPFRFMTKELPIYQRSALALLANFLHADVSSMAFVQNATTGMNAVIRSQMMKWSAGDEILTTNHVYGAVRNTLLYAASCTHATIIEASIPFPIMNEQQIVQAIESAITDKTVFLCIDHITSPSGIIFPIKQIIELAHSKGIPILVDGAHAPGMIDLHIEDLQPDWYTGNCHKWLFAPKGCAFLWTHPKYQKDTHPTVISHGYLLGYIQEFDWTGTNDFSAYLSISTALDFYAAAGAGTLRAYQSKKAIEIRNLLSSAWNTPLASPDSMIGSLAAQQIPSHLWPDKQDHQAYAEALHDVLWEKYTIEVPVIAFANTIWIRISVQVFNTDEQYHYLAEVIKKMRKKDILTMMKSKNQA